MNRLTILSVLLLGVFSANAASKSYTLTSPDGKTSVTATVDGKITYSVKSGDITVIAPSTIALTLDSGTILGENPKVLKARQGSLDETIEAPLYRQSRIEAACNTLDLKMAGGYGLQFRAYDDGVAYRFYTAMKEPLTIANETVEFNFDNDYKAYIPYTSRKNLFESSFESQYTYAPLSEFRPRSEALSFLPLLVDMGAKGKVLLMESDVEAYPGMFISYNADKGGVYGIFPPYPKRFERIGYDKTMKVVEGENFVAKVEGTRTYPWRIVSFVEEDRELPTNDMVFKTASPSRIENPGWIRSGKSTWDWWNGWNLSGVDFEAGINTDTYKYYVDFAKKFGLEYVIVDDGWYDDHDIMKPRKVIDLDELLTYASSKGIKVVLWTTYYTLDQNLEAACKRYSEMGVAGFKVDFFDRQDQQIVECVYRIADVAARYGLLIDLHGIYKPTGLRRTYPNIINYEGVFGLEQLKWTDKDAADMPYNDVVIPFTRMAAGPIDYTQGAMLNANKRNFRSIHQQPMSQGTRAHQVATYVVFDSPLVMLCDSPTHYLREAETTSYIASIPTDFETTSVLDGKVGEYIVTARSKDGKWYVGGLTSWTPRDMDLDLSFLGEGSWTAEIFADGINAAKVASDYKITSREVNGNSKLRIHMAPGGGFAIKFVRK